MKCCKCNKNLGKGDKFQIIHEGVFEEKEQEASKENDKTVKTLMMKTKETKFYCEEHKLK